MKKSSLKQRICITCSVMFIVITMILFVFTTASYQSIIRGGFTESAESSMELFTEMVNNYDNQMIETVDILAKNSSFKKQVKDKDATNFTATMDILLSCTNADVYIVYDSKGKLLASTVKKHLDHLKSLMDEAFVRGEDEPTTVDTYLGDDGYITKFACAPITYGNEMAGAIGIGYVLTNDELVDSIKNITGAEIAVITNGKNVSTTVHDGEERLNGSEINAEILTSVNDTKERYIGEDIINNERYMTCYQPVLDNSGEVSFMMFSGTSIENRSVSMTNITIIVIVGAIAAAFVFIIVLISFVNRYVSKPIRQMVTVTKNISDGQIGLSDPELVKVDVEQNNEIGQMGMALSVTVSSLRQYISEIDRVLTSICDGDLTVEAGSSFRGDFEQVKTNLVSIVDNLREIIGELQISTTILSDHAERIATDASELSSGSAQQSAAVDELFASIENVAKDVDQTAEKAEDTRAITARALAVV
ncbi:MAG: cache domain-containing protein, partial [Oscillospiraceae bacterium]